MSDRSTSQRLIMEIAIVAGRMAELLRSTLSGSPDASDAQGFLVGFYGSNHGDIPLHQWDANPLSRFSDEEDHPFARLARAFGWEALYMNLVLLAGMAEEHEGFSAVLRSLHPRGEARPSIGLAAHLFCGNAEARLHLRQLLERNSTASGSALRLTGDGPFYDRSLMLTDALWPVLHGLDVWPAQLAVIDTQPAMQGLEEWFDSRAARQAAAGLAKQQALTVLVPGETEDIAFHRALALAAHSGLVPIGFSVAATADGETERSIELHCAARGATPVLKMNVPDGPGGGRILRFRDYRAPVFVALRAGTASYEGTRPMLSVPVERLSPAARQRMWTQILPALAAEAPSLAAQFPIEPALAVDTASDLALVWETKNQPAVADVAEALRSRANQLLTGGIQLFRPLANWSNLVLAPEREKQLREAASRLRLQGRVLDEWGFLRGRPGARGCRMLFSGPPGTGKTLSAEVIAAELKVDLLLVDISRVVSKWIGETEKNLAAVFDTAERARAVLFFDEADALFGKRTEVSDAHDRYANLETAYLLTRLERFDGLAILATNLRSNLDPALMRRMEFALDFSEPDRQERAGIWRAHVPETAPVDADVDFDEIAALFPIVGGLIRNASVAAAFLAASDGGVISRRHLVTAVRREYEKVSRVFPATAVAS